MACKLIFIVLLALATTYANQIELTPGNFK